MRDYWIISAVAVLTTISVFILNSITSTLFPFYFLYIGISVVVYILLSKIDFETWSVFYKHLYILSLLFLTLPILVGEVTRGAVRWIPIGSLTVQPSEIVRPFLLLFFANFITRQRLTILSTLKGITLIAIPTVLIAFQPSLGISILTLLGFLGVFLASEINKRIIAIALAIFLLLAPFSWFFMAPYQRARVLSFIEPLRDPRGAGYNSLQSTIAVGSGRFFGRGLGEGVQTQLAFLPERHTDFIFASVAEELGFIGAILTIGALGVVLYRIILALENAINPTARAFIAGAFLTLFAQVIIHIGMNMGLFPITGIPLPFVSAGGSSLIASTIMLVMIVGAVKKV